MQMALNPMMVAATLTTMLLLSACAGSPGAPEVRFSNVDRSDERRANDNCRASTDSGDVGGTAAYHACMARYRRPPDDE